MGLIERFLKYVQIDTESMPESTLTPSTLKQKDLGRILVEELHELGLNNAMMSEEGIVYAWLKSNLDRPCDKVGFVAHMDTSPDMSGKNVNPRLIKNYDGKDIVLNEALNIKMSPKDFPSLKEDIGSDLIVTDGTTLLGADDKAGIAEIMDMIAYFVAHPEQKHGDIAIAFTPDEEVGRGTENFDVKLFNADYAYTVDGGNVNEVDYENFNAASAKVIVNGLSIHPGGAKAKMKNSLLMAMEFQSLLPVFDNPAYTEGYEGFNHLTTLSGDCEKTVMNYIIRNHDKALLEKQKGDFENAALFMNRKYGDNSIELVIEDTYANMRSYIEKKMSMIEIVYEAIRDMGMTPVSHAIRGGTDGASLTYMGLPCPNLGTGGRQCHGKYEYASINEMKKASELLIRIVKKIAA
jgi:peptidase T